MTPIEHQCASILSAAASAEFGLVLRTNDPARARALLYKVRKDIGDSEWNKLMIRISPDDSEHELWIIRNGATPLLDLKATELLL